MADDKFEDVIDRELGGSLDRGALKEFDSVQTQLVPEGLKAEVGCRSCGRRYQLTISYPELIAIKCNISPSRVFQDMSPWQPIQAHDGVNWMPVGIRCSGCPDGGPVYVCVTPSEANAVLRRALGERFLSSEQEVQWGQMCMRVVRGGR